MPDELTKDAGAQNQSEAELIQNLLEAAGIPSVVRRSGGADVPTSWRPGGGMCSCPRRWHSSRAKR
jgi:hypothetical protein